MRTYDPGKRHGVPAGRALFSECAGDKKKFDFVEFILSEDGPVVGEPDWLAGLLDSKRYRDGSYEGYSNRVAAGTISSPDIHGTCYTAIVIKTIGGTPEKKALDYVEKLKTPDGSFALGPGNRLHSDVETTHWAVLALKASGKSVPEASIRYAKSLRNRDGSYSGSGHCTLEMTRCALTILKAGGVELSAAERDETISYIMARIGDDGIERKAFEGDTDLDNCYDAAVSLNILDYELPPEKRNAVLSQLGCETPHTEEQEFRILAARKCLGAPHGKPGRKGAGEPPKSIKGACHGLWSGKLVSRAKK